MATLTAQGHSVELIPTTAPHSATDNARECVRRGARMVIAAGGDGTINEVLNGLACSDVPLAVLPGGTANVLAVELGLGNDMVRAARALADAVPVRVSLGVLHAEGRERYFLLMAGVGLDAHIVYNLDPSFKAKWGKLSYWLSGFGVVNRPLHEFTAVIDGTKHRCSFALASRVRNYGGDIEIACNASLFDDHFEVVLFEGRHASVYLKYFFGVLTRQLGRMRGVSLHRVHQAEFLGPSDPGVYVQIDGEHVGRLPVRVEIAPQCLTLMVPPDFCRRFGRPVPDAVAVD